MRRRLYSLAPTGAPLRGGDILAGLRGLCGGEDVVSRFKEEICQYFRVNHAALVSSGKAALAIALRALSEVSMRREVIIPAFSSFCLASAVAKTGLRIRLCDVRPDTLDFDLEQLTRMVTEETLCVIPVHLFGLSSQVDRIQEITKSQGAYVVEDAAQGAGGQLHARKFGTIGDIGVISLGRGKNVSTVEGGILLTSSPSLAEKMQQCLEAQEVGEWSASEQLHAMVKALVLSIFLRPGAYWFPEQLPFLKLGTSEFSTEFDIRSFSRLHAGIGGAVFSQLDRYNQIRCSHAAYLMNQLKIEKEILMPQPLPQSCPAYLRFPVLFKNGEVRDLVYRLLARNKLGVSTTYPTTLRAIPELRPYTVGLADTYPGAEWVASRIMTLPTHPYVSHADLKAMVGIVRSHMGGSDHVKDDDGQSPTVSSRSFRRN